MPSDNNIPPLLRNLPPTITPPPLPKATAAAPAAAPAPKYTSKRPGPILTPEELDRFKDLLVFAKSTVEGYFSGKHKSPYHGASAEFSDYKEYSPGDDVSQLDWRVYGRSRRLFLRQFEQETDMVVYLLVDASASMNYAGKTRQSKFFLAAKIAAALAYLMMNQGDKASLTLFAHEVTSHIPPGGTRRHLHRMVTDLEQAIPSQTTGMAEALTECVSLFKKRGRLVVISDFLTDHAGLFDALGQFLHRKFEVLLLHVTDPDELYLPALSVARFVDMETREVVEVETEEIRAHYRARMKEVIDTLASEAHLRAISHSLVSTENPYIDAIEAYLGFRGRNLVTAR